MTTAVTGTGHIGLTSAEAVQRLAQQGANVLPRARERGPLRMALDQFTNLMVLVLVGAAVLAAVLGERTDMVAILAIVVLNGILGFLQEYRADRALAALRALVAPTARVRRDGHEQTIPASTLVAGDLVLLDAGAMVPADLRLLEAWRLQIDESMLTGESLAVAKEGSPLGRPEASEGPEADRRDRAYTGTLVVTGRGVGVVVATGAATELGRIALLMVAQPASATPLQRRLTALTRQLAVGVLIICTAVFLYGLWRHEPTVPMFLTALSLAVAAIPEALPAVVTVLLAVGAHRLARKGALIRRLPAVETLGSVTCIACDKTGTLTENRMHVEAVVMDHQRLHPAAGLGDSSEMALALRETMVRCNDAVRAPDGSLSGDPTEVALLHAAAAGGWVEHHRHAAPRRLAELPFSSARARMTTLHATPRGVRAFTKGAPERVIPACGTMLTARGVEPIDALAVLEQAHALAGSGLRVLAFARRDLDALPAELEDAERDQCLLGLVGLLDPPRDGAAQAIVRCREAGIRVIMLTGDHPHTARAIAVRLGLLDDTDHHRLLTGAQLATLSAAQLAAAVDTTVVFARVTPEDKHRIVSALQARGELVAMTGDGVNDAPALRRADIGIAMGRAGTDAAREAANMVLLDDGFPIIVGAVREGRRIHDNLRKFVRFVLTGNAGEIWVLALAPLFGLPLPLLPIHLLWVNLVTDGLPGLAYAAERAEGDVMQRPPRPPGESLFADGLGTHIAWVGLLLGGVTLAVQALAWHGGNPRWQSMTFTVMTLAQLTHALSIRSERAALWTTGLTSNRSLLGAVLVTLGLQLAVLYVPLLQTVFRTQPLTLPDLAWCGAAALVVVAVVEFAKAVDRARRRVSA